jgi:hypothetical protein
MVLYMSARGAQGDKGAAPIQQNKNCACSEDGIARQKAEGRKQKAGPRQACVGDAYL